MASSAALSYWQELFNNEKLSPPEYKYLFPDLNNVANEAVKQLLTSKLTDEMCLMEETEWAGLDAVGQTAFWLKVLSEPKIGQLRKCKLEYIGRMMAKVVGSDLLPNPHQEDSTAGFKVEVMEQKFTEEDEDYPSLDVSHLDSVSDMDSPPVNRVKHNSGAQRFNSHAETDQHSTGVVPNNSIPLPKLEPAPKFALPMNSMLSMPSFPDVQINPPTFSSLYAENPAEVATSDADQEDNEMSNMWTAITENGNTEFSCSTCHYKSTYKSRIKQHIRSVHSAIKPYKCDFCDHTTAVRASLTKHINAVHRKIKPFSCNLCNYSCSLKSSLDVHMAGVHQKSYRHSCPHCPYAAAAKNVVEIHIKAVHKREKPYKCPKPGCGYSSAYPQYIPKHIAAVHDRSKPFACPHCPYRSSYKAYLQKHCDAVHNNIKPHACPHCSYVTSYAQYLNKHISAVHKDEKPHKCPHCHFRCAYKQYISKHIELVHSGNAKSVAAVNETLSNISKPQEDLNEAGGTGSQVPPVGDLVADDKGTLSSDGVVSGSVMEFVNNNPDGMQAAWPEME